MVVFFFFVCLLFLLLSMFASFTAAAVPPLGVAFLWPTLHPITLHMYTHVVLSLVSFFPPGLDLNLFYCVICLIGIQQAVWGEIFTSSERICISFLSIDTPPHPIFVREGE